MRRLRGVTAIAVLGVVFLGGFLAGARSSSQSMEHENEVYRSPNGTTLRLLLDENNLGGTEIEIGEITFPPGANSGSHPHGSTEIFYVLSGELEHVVNGTTHRLGPGDLGFVRPPDEVNHVVPGDSPVRALVIWAPGGEAGRITSRWERVR